MKKLLLASMLLGISLPAFAQQNIQTSNTQKSEMTNVETRKILEIVKATFGSEDIDVYNAIVTDPIQLKTVRSFYSISSDKILKFKQIVFSYGVDEAPTDMVLKNKSVEACTLLGAESKQTIAAFLSFFRSYLEEYSDPRDGNVDIMFNRIQSELKKRNLI
jgi:hypothetical protein